jgi:hypothetical protein
MCAPPLPTAYSHVARITRESLYIESTRTDSGHRVPFHDRRFALCIGGARNREIDGVAEHVAATFRRRTSAVEVPLGTAISAVELWFPVRRDDWISKNEEYPTVEAPLLVLAVTERWCD